MATSKRKPAEDDDDKPHRDPGASLAKVEKLFRLATDDSASEEEARTAALKCVRLMKEESLTVVPSDELAQVKKKIEGMAETMQKMKKAMNGQFMKGLGVAFLAQRVLKL